MSKEKEVKDKSTKKAFVKNLKKKWAEKALKHKDKSKVSEV